MKVNRSKKIILIVAVLIVALLAANLTFKNTQASERSVKILDYDFSICTLDVPSSSCGPYEVNVESKKGAKLTYIVAGFDNRKNKKYDDISSTIRAAKQQGNYVMLEVNNKGEIVSISQ